MPSKRSVLSAAALAGPLVLGTAQAQLFTVNCSPLTIQRGDPIVWPGQISPHVHVVTGGTAFQQTQSNEQARSALATTCDKLLDKSNYWQPQLYHQRRDGRFELVTMQGNAAYYIKRACDYAPGRQNCDGAPTPIAPPRGLRMVTGDPLLRTYNQSSLEQQAIAHFCLEGPNEGETPHMSRLPCGRMRAETFFPSCWDGRSLDSGNHKDHMAFPAIGAYNFGVCPESHPKAILSVFYEFFYDTGAIQDPNRLVWAMGDPTGYGLHGDYLQGWTDQQRLDDAIATCTGPRGVDDRGCSLNVGQDGSPGHSSAQKVEVAEPAEPVGKQGPLDRLPGNNPVTGNAV
ncbi:WSC domain-containing protein [Cordyceps javanica]|uniref:WSC domain-containing protein n=1 Tax=Cordyceps javanica TaxID=43265 RepID=A0A545VDH9_9HYPO|nr:WSC domain-containing protein [Cordyceps javanica]TQW10553.1 WSC domain protein [Cordyceps javanica]